MKTALYTVLLAAGIWVATLLETLSRAGFALLLAAYRWIQANPATFSFLGILAFAILFVYTVNRANAPKNP